MRVRLAEQRVNECHRSGPGADDEVIGLDRVRVHTCPFRYRSPDQCAEPIRQYPAEQAEVPYPISVARIHIEMTPTKSFERSAAGSPRRRGTNAICATETFRPHMTARNPEAGRTLPTIGARMPTDSPAASANQTYNQQERRRSNRRLND